MSLEKILALESKTLSIFCNAGLRLCIHCMVADESLNGWVGGLGTSV